MRIGDLATAASLVAIITACSSTSTNDAGGGGGGNAGASGEIIHCGSQSCDPKSLTCCFDPQTFSSECVATGTCAGDHYPYVCDSTSDCAAANQAGKVCCAYVAFGNIKASSCADSCAAPMEQLCDQSRQECPAGKSCLASPHPPSYFFTCQ